MWGLIRNSLRIPGLLSQKLEEEIKIIVGSPQESSGWDQKFCFSFFSFQIFSFFPLFFSPIFSSLFPTFSLFSSFSLAPSQFLGFLWESRGPTELFGDWSHCFPWKKTNSGNSGSLLNPWEP